MNIRKIIYVLVTVLAAAWTARMHVAQAEPLEFMFEHYSSDDGLPHNSICDIHQDSRGYLWLCTWYGLSRYDGNGFVNYTMLPGDYSNLSHNRILSVREDAAGYLWVTTYDYHLYRFDVRTEEFVAVPGELEDFPVSGIQVGDVMPDSAGNMWLSINGTGLLKVRPDLTYEHYFGRIGKDISSIFEDSQGTVYAVSDMGISMVRDGKVSLLSRDSDVVAFVEKDCSLFFACSDHLLRVDMTSREQTRVDFAGLGVSEATSMVKTGKSQTIYVGFRDNAVASLDAQTMSLSLRRNDMGRVRYLFPDPEGLLWIATERTGIYSYDSSKNRFRHYEHSSNVMSYYVDTLACVRNSGDRLWIKMNNYGFGYYDRDSDQIVPLRNVREQQDCRFMNGVACYDIDASGVLWMSTVGRGLERVTVISPNIDVIVPPTRSPDPKSSSEVRAMLRDSRGYVWVATKSRELYRYSSDMKECRRFPDRRSGDIGVIYSIFEDRDGNIWLGTKGDGLLRMRPDGNDYEWTRYRRDPSVQTSISSDNIYSIEQDMDGRIWVGTYGGALSMLPDADSREFITVDNSFPAYPQEVGDRVRYLHCMPDGLMLVATVGGLITFRPVDNPELTTFDLVQKIPGDRKSLGNNDVIHMFTDRGGNTWLCTFGGGLNRIYFEEEVPRFDVISTEEGLVSNIVHSAVDDSEGMIWIATEAGLSSYDPETSKLRNYTSYDGVPSTSYSEATCACLEDGSVLFGTYDNIYKVVPGRFADSDPDSRIVVSGLYIDGRRVPFDDEMVIPYDCSFFRVDFASLDFGDRGDLSLSYMLEGYDKTWISSSGVNRVTYSRIPPGNYLFKVMETYPDDPSAANVTSVRVKVKPSVWNSVYAIVIYVLLALGLVVVVFRLVFISMKLRTDMKLEQGLSDIKMRFFTNVSHELRTPLTLILGGIEEVERNTETGSRNEYSVNVVKKNARRMLTLVNQLLDTRSMADGHMRLNVTMFDVVRLVQDIYDDFRDMSVERQMELRIIKSVDSLMVWGDAIRLEALVYNLLSNAFKYTSDGGKIEVGVLYREGDEEFRIMVKDNGIGVAKEYQKSIFEPFNKGNASAFRGMSSSGIGLSFCKEIAEIHGGEIWVESDKGGAGSKFFVRLPVGKGHQSEAHGLSKYKVEPTCPEDAQKVLVVEDNAELRIYIYNSLSARYNVRDAGNGKEALQVIAEGWIPDMVITDLMMPQMDGMELIEALRDDFNTSHIPIVMITARHEDDTHVRAMKYGADGYIAKPFSMALLEARIDNIFERRMRLMKKSGRIDVSPEEIVITDRDEQLIRKVMAWMEENVADPDITIDQLATHVGMGRTSMYNKIKGLTGKAPVELIQEFRMEKAKFYLKSGQYSVSETSYKVGFSDPGYFSRCFKKHFGVSPADYIKQSKNN